eukprot:gene43440-biopygen25572
MEYLERIGVPDAMCAYLLAQLEGTSKVWTAHGWTREIEVKRGTRQGGVESPLLFLLLVDPILHILDKELQASFVKRKLVSKAGPWQGHDTRSGDVFRFHVSEDGDLQCATKDIDGFSVEKVAWDGRALDCAGAGQLVINDAVVIEPQLDGVAGMGRLRGLCEELGIDHNLEEAVLCRGPVLSSRPGFLGAYADDLLVGHADPAFLRAIMRMLGEFYAVIGCEINLSKSHWMVVHGRKDGSDRPHDTAKLQLICPGGHIVYLGFRVSDKGMFGARSSLTVTFQAAVNLLPGGGSTAGWGARFVSGVLNGWLLYYGGSAVLGRSTLLLLDQLARRLIRKCGRLRPDHPTRLLTCPIWQDGIMPASVIYAAAIVSFNHKQ